MQSAEAYLSRVFGYLRNSLRSLPLVMVLGAPEAAIPVLSFAVQGVPADRVNACVAALKAQGYPHTCKIGLILPQGEALEPITLIA